MYLLVSLNKHKIFYSIGTPNPNAPCTIHVWAESSAPASIHCLRYGLEQAPLVFNSRYRMRKPAAKESPAPNVSTACTSFGV